MHVCTLPSVCNRRPFTPYSCVCLCVCVDERVETRREVSVHTFASMSAFITQWVCVCVCKVGQKRDDGRGGGRSSGVGHINIAK